MCILTRRRVTDEVMGAAFDHSNPPSHWPDMASPPPPSRALARDLAGYPRAMLDLMGYPPPVPAARLA